MNKKLIDWRIGSGTSYSADAQAVFTNIGGTLSTSVKNAIATFVDAEVAAGRWTNYLDVFQLWGTALGSEAQGLKNWISSSFNATNTNGVTATVNGYDFLGSPATQEMTTGYNPTNGTKWTALNAIQGVYVNRNDTTTDQLVILRSSGANYWYQRTASSRLDFINGSMNGAQTRQIVTYASGWEQGLWTSKQVLNTGPNFYGQQIYKNGTDLGTAGAGTTTVETNTEILIGGPTGGLQFNGVLSGYYAGAGTGFDVSAFYTNYLTLITALGIKI